MASSSVSKAALVAGAVLLATACGGPPGKASDPRVVTVDGTSAKSTLPAPSKPCEGKHVADADPASAEGQRIVDVCISGAAPDTIAAVRSAMQLRADKKLTAEALRSDLAAAYATRRVDQIEVTGKTGGGGVLLLVRLEERPRIADIRVEASGASAKGAPADAFAKPGDHLDIAKLFATEAKVKESFVEDGWDETQVSHDIRLDGTRAHLTIKVTPGVRRKVGKVIFDGAQPALTAPLRKAVELEEGSPLGPPHLERAGLLVNTFYYDRGYMTVRVDTPTAVRGADGATAITFKIVEGPIFRIGTVKVRGVDAATEKEVLAKLTSKAGEIFSRAKVVKDLDAIRAMFKERGKPDASIEPETALDPKKQIVDLVLGISGG